MKLPKSANYHRTVPLTPAHSQTQSYTKLFRIVSRPKPTSPLLHIPCFPPKSFGLFLVLISPLDTKKQYCRACKRKILLFMFFVKFVLSLYNEKWKKYAFLVMKVLGNECQTFITNKKEWIITLKRTHYNPKCITESINVWILLGY